MAIGVEIGLKDSGFSSAMRAINAELKATDTYVSNVDKSINQLGKSEDALKNKIDALANKQEVLNKRFDLQADRLKQGKDKVEEYKTALQNLDRTSETYEADAKKLTDAIEKQESANNRLATEMKTTQEQIKQVEHASKSCETEIADLGNAMDDAGEDANTMEENLDTLTKMTIAEAFREYADAIADFGKKGLEIFGSLIESGAEYSAETAQMEMVYGNLGSATQKAIDQQAKLGSQFALTERQTKSATVELSSYYKAMGYTDEEIANMLPSITQLVADMSAFADVPFDDALGDFKSALMGKLLPLFVVIRIENRTKSVEVFYQR